MSIFNKKKRLFSNDSRIGNNWGWKLLRQQQEYYNKWVQEICSKYFVRPLGLRYNRPPPKDCHRWHNKKPYIDKDCWHNRFYLEEWVQPPSYLPIFLPPGYKYHSHSSY